MMENENYFQNIPGQEPAMPQTPQEPVMQQAQPQMTQEPTMQQAQPQTSQEPTMQQAQPQMTQEPYFNRLDGQQNSWQANQSYQQYQNGPQGQAQQYAPVMQPAKPKKKASFFKKAAAVVVLGLLFGACVGVGTLAVRKATGNLNIYADQKSQNKKYQIEESADGRSREAASEETARPAEVIKEASTPRASVVTTDISDIVEDVMPAMVSILNNGTTEMQFWGQTYTREMESSGTGIIISQNDTELLIATNHHVAADATKLEVTFIDGKKAQARIKGMDSDMDLAVIAVNLDDIEAETKKEIAIAKLGDSEDLKLGKPVIVIGNALGYGQSVTTGIISGLNRELTMDDGSKGTFIQTDAAVNPGNSGGALFNVDGEVIGIVSSKIGGTTIEGMGYAIPISSANPIFAEMMERRTRGDRVKAEDIGYMGVTLQEITADARRFYDMPAGVYIYEVEPGSAAHKADIRKGDIIVKVEGEKIDGRSALIDILQYYKAGDTISVTVSRQENGEYVEKEMELTLGQKPKQIEE